MSTEKTTPPVTEMNKSLRAKPVEGADSNAGAEQQDSGAPATNLDQSAGQDTGNQDQQNNQESTEETSDAGKDAGAEGAGVGAELIITSTQEETSTASATPAADDAPVVEEQQTEVVVLPTHLASLKDRLDQYLAAMGPGRSPSDVTGRQQQMSLWRSIQLVLRQEGSNFTDCMNMLLDFIHANRAGCFNERLLFRFIPELTLGKDDRITFERLLSTFIDTADASSRVHTVKQVDLKKVLVKLNDARVEQRLRDFYRIS